MKGIYYVLLLYAFLMLPPVASLMESVMIIHMHMQMTLFVIIGFLLAPVLQKKFPRFFEEWNPNGIPGILLFVIVIFYWTLPRSMDEALNFWYIELFKFISLPFLAGVPLRDSWRKISPSLKNGLIILFTLLFILMGWLYIWSPNQLCNNYLMIDQITLGWGFLLTAVCMIIYLAYSYITDFAKTV
ncbi:hypothetical protein GCM10007216_06120 [Thalassobacillus devorans]|uniref:Uncharacterized protein n=1 Tax=Thalassobacillus devorans TaxID=279813 RepID=A0ABQ1NIZ2_9BACI|nr:hypothetical protein [Thalassobacillus devorans]NIK27525.1 hypothetical protein [Thalassobacillus devorans]GGC78352.1 hypothetical protein GCM10007216_06120 [Thalassobacillus devorans]